MGAVFLSGEFVAGVKAGGQRWLVGVSGGGDSVALLRLLVEAGLRNLIVVGCFNHGWGPFGDESAAFVETLAGELGVEFRTGQGHGKAASNAEAMARDTRYEWFGEVCAAEGLAGVMVAHTQDDMVESFLMRAGKGSGLGGLAGMRAESGMFGLVWLRPLLGAGREDLREYLRELGQAWMEDPDNEAGGSQRARVRKLLPLLEKVGVTLHGMAASVAALADADDVVRDLVREFPLEIGASEVKWKLAGFAGVPVELAVRVLARVMAEVCGEGMIVRRGKRVALWQRMGGEASGAATLGGVKFTWRDGTITARAE